MLGISLFSQTCLPDTHFFYIYIYEILAILLGGTIWYDFGGKEKSVFLQKQIRKIYLLMSYSIKTISFGREQFRLSDLS